MAVRRPILVVLLAILIAGGVGAVAEAQEAAEVLTGRVLAPGREPVVGASITVADADGTPVGTSVTGDDGRWTVPLPGPGAYTVSLDLATVPSDVVVLEPVIETEVAASQEKAVTFVLQPAEAEVPTGDDDDDEDGEPADDGPSQEFRGVIITRDDPSTPDVDEAEPVEGVVITVVDEAGEQVGEDETDEEGVYAIALPEPGTYTATIDVDTLPDGVELTNSERVSLTVPVRPGQSRPLLFPLGEGSSSQGSLLERIAQNSVLGLSFGLVIAMTAIGLSLIFGTTGLTNFAHGELVTFGALAAFFFNVHLDLPLPIATPLAMVVAAVAGGLQDLAIWSPLRRRRTGLVAMLVISIGLAILFRFLFLNVFQGRSRPYAFGWGNRANDYGPISISGKDLLSIVISIVVLVAVGLVLQRTRIGKAMRAVSDNPALAASSGIDVDRVILFVWALAGALACLGGVLFGATQEGVSFQMGFQLLLLMFAGVTLGGLGTAYGALVGSIVVGLLVQLSTLVISPELKNVGALLVLILILLVRPQGILGRAERIG